MTHVNFGLRLVNNSRDTDQVTFGAVKLRRDDLGLNFAKRVTFVVKVTIVF